MYRSANNKRVLLLNPFADNCKKSANKEKSKTVNGHLMFGEPLGLSYIFTYAKSKMPECEFHILDGHGLLYETAYKGMEFNWQVLLKKINDIHPNIIGIGAYYFRSANLFHETCRRIKKELPHVSILAGGNYPSDAPGKVLLDSNVDFIIKNEGEFAFVEFLKEFFSNKNWASLDNFVYQNSNGEIIAPNTPKFIKDLSKMPIPNRSYLPMHIYGNGRDALDRVLEKKRALSMTISRGCPYECTFCTAKNFWGRRIRYRDTESVLDEMEMLKKEYNATVIEINDDNFLFNKKKVTEILNGMIERNLNLKWASIGGSSVRALNDDAFLDLAIKSGYCFFNLAIESSSDETLRRIKKPVRIKEVEELISKIRTRYPHMYVNAFFIVGFPFEKKKDIIKTLEWSKTLELDWASHFIFKPFPNTELYDECLTKNLIQEFDFNYGENFMSSNVNGDDWDADWLLETNYLYNLKINFLENRNLKIKNYVQALRDFEYIIRMAPRHALAFRMAKIASEALGDNEKVILYTQQEKSILNNPQSEFHKWYKRLSLKKPV